MAKCGYELNGKLGHLGWLPTPPVPWDDCSLSHHLEQSQDMSFLSHEAYEETTVMTIEHDQSRGLGRKERRGEEREREQWSYG